MLLYLSTSVQFVQIRVESDFIHDRRKATRIREGFYT